MWNGIQVSAQELSGQFTDRTVIFLHSHRLIKAGKDLYDPISLNFLIYLAI